MCQKEDNTNNIQREKGQYHFPGSERSSEPEQLVISSDKKTLVAVENHSSKESLHDAATARKILENEEIALKQLSEQRLQLEQQIREQKEHAVRARAEEQKELDRLRAESERLKLEEERHLAESKKLQDEATAELARLQAEAAKREISLPADGTPPADTVA